VHAAAGQRVQVDRQGRHQRLAFTGAHFGDLALVQGDAGGHLHVEVAHAEHPPACFAHHREGFGQQVVEAGAGGKAFLELAGLGGQFGVGKFFQSAFKRTDRGDGLDVCLEHPVIAAAENLFE